MSDQLGVDDTAKPADLSLDGSFQPPHFPESWQEEFNQLHDWVMPHIQQNSILHNRLSQAKRVMQAGQANEEVYRNWLKTFQQLLSWYRPYHRNHNREQFINLLSAHYVPTDTVDYQSPVARAEEVLGEEPSAVLPKEPVLNFTARMAQILNQVAPGVRCDEHDPLRVDCYLRRGPSRQVGQPDFIFKEGQVSYRTKSADAALVTLRVLQRDRKRVSNFRSEATVRMFAEALEAHPEYAEYVNLDNLFEQAAVYGIDLRTLKRRLQGPRRGAGAGTIERMLDRKVQRTAAASPEPEPVEAEAEGATASRAVASEAEAEAEGATASRAAASEAVAVDSVGESEAESEAEPVPLKSEPEDFTLLLDSLDLPSTETFKGSVDKEFSAINEALISAGYQPPPDDKEQRKTRDRKIRQWMYRRRLDPRVRWLVSSDAVLRSTGIRIRHATARGIDRLNSFISVHEGDSFDEADQARLQKLTGAVGIRLTPEQLKVIVTMCEQNIQFPAGGWQEQILNTPNIKFPNPLAALGPLNESTPFKWTFDPDGQTVHIQFLGPENVTKVNLEKLRGFLKTVRTANPHLSRFRYNVSSHVDCFVREWDKLTDNAALTSSFAQYGYFYVNDQSLLDWYVAQKKHVWQQDVHGVMTRCRECGITVGEDLRGKLSSEDSIPFNVARAEDQTIVITLDTTPSFTGISQQSVAHLIELAQKTREDTGQAVVIETKNKSVAKELFLNGAHMPPEALDFLSVREQIGASTSTSWLDGVQKQSAKEEKEFNSAVNDVASTMQTYAQDATNAMQKIKSWVDQQPDDHLKQELRKLQEPYSKMDAIYRTAQNALGEQQSGQHNMTVMTDFVKEMMPHVKRALLELPRLQKVTPEKEKKRCVHESMLKLQTSGLYTRFHDAKQVLAQRSATFQAQNQAVGESVTAIEKALEPFANGSPPPVQQNIDETLQTLRTVMNEIATRGSITTSQLDQVVRDFADIYPEQGDLEHAIAANCQQILEEHAGQVSLDQCLTNIEHVISEQSSTEGNSDQQAAVFRGMRVAVQRVQERTKQRQSDEKQNGKSKRKSKSERNSASNVPSSVKRKLKNRLENFKKQRPNSALLPPPG